MKNILELTTAADLTAWGKYFLVVKSPTISTDPATAFNRAVIVKDFEAHFESQTILIKVVLYLLDANGDPINGFKNPSQKNIKPLEIDVPATNESYVNLQTMQVVPNLNGLTEGVDYLTPSACESIELLSELPQTVSHLPEFEAYRIIANTQNISMRDLMANAVAQSSRI